MNWFPWIATVHVLGVVLWIGSLWAASRLMLLQLDGGEAALGGASVKLFKSSAGHGMMLTVLAGLGMFLMRPGVYLHQGWFHLKLTLVAGLIAVHFLLRAQAKKLEAEPRSASRSAVSGLSAALAGGAAVILLLVFIQPF